MKLFWRAIFVFLFLLAIPSVTHADERQKVAILPTIMHDYSAEKDIKVLIQDRLKKHYHKPLPSFTSRFEVIEGVPGGLFAELYDKKRTAITADALYAIGEKTGADIIIVAELNYFENYQVSADEVVFQDIKIVIKYYYFAMKTKTFKAEKVTKQLVGAAVTFSDPNQIVNEMMDEIEKRYMEKL